jgi:hypothetical protein
VSTSEGNGARLLAEVEELRRAHDVLLLRLERATVPPPRAPSSVPATATPSGEIAEKLLRTARRAVCEWAPFPHVAARPGIAGRRRRRGSSVLPPSGRS